MEAYETVRETQSTYLPLWNPATRYVLVTGGRGSGKSDAVALSTCDEITTFEDWTVLYTRWTLVSAEISIIPEFRDKVEILGRGDNVAFSGNVVQCGSTGSRLIFSGIKSGSGTQTARLKSIKGLNKLIVEEAEEFVNEKEFNTLDDSIRQLGVPNIIVIVMNPQDTEHWVWKRWLENSHRMIEVDGCQIPISTHPDITHIHTTYFDNLKNLNPEYLAKIEKLRQTSRAAYEHRYLGKWQDKKEGAIYPNWIEGEFDTSLPFCYGLDFGFYPDPLALVMVAVDSSKMLIYVKEVVYETELSHDNVLKSVRAGVQGEKMVIADTSEPRMIDALAAIGLNIQKTDKYPGSVEDGIKRINDFKIVVTPESYNVKTELRNYVWNDKKSSTPVDAYNHALDALRYSAMRLLEGSSLLAGN